MRLVTRWIRKLHLYTGLLNLTIVMVFGIAGVAGTLGVERRFAVSTETRDFRVPPNMTDQEAGTAAFESLHLPLTEQLPRNAIHRDADNNLTFTTYSVNGPRVITVLEKEGRIRIEVRKNRLWHYFDNLHSSTPTRGAADPRMRLWSAYVEFSIWSLLFMSASGVYLWLASRPRYRWAQLSFALGGGGFAVLYALLR